MNLGEIGIYVIAAMMIIREARDFAGKRKHQGAAGDKPTEFWILAIRQIINDGVAPVLSKQEAILEEIKKLVK